MELQMQTRRDILRLVVRFVFWSGATVGLDFSRIACAFERVKTRVVPRGTDPNSLRNANPEFLDTRNLQVMPLEAFGTMGDKDAPFDPHVWRLELEGAVQKPLQLTYDEILNLPAIERDVLLVCPGVFANYGRWKGISIRELIETAGPTANMSTVIIHGLSGVGDRKELFTIDDIKTDKVFLSYAVNGTILPRRHGFPLRVVAEGHWGSHWAKHVYKVELR
jgi:sulfoxide reductase catalytic subunit YedY